MCNKNIVRDITNWVLLKYTFKQLEEVEKREEPKKGRKYNLEKYQIKIEDISTIVYLFYLLGLL